MGERPCSCCFDDEFDEKTASDHVRDYGRNGAPAATRILAEGLARDGVEGRTVLDIGAGVGALHHALLERGASTVVDVDASQSYLDSARAEAGRRGYTDRVRFEHGDFTVIGDRIDAADLVALDRSVCCHPDMRAMVGLAAARTRHRLGLVLPRDIALVRLGIRGLNLIEWLRRSSFRVYGHSHDEISRVAGEAGLTEVERRTSGMWAVLIYARQDPTTTSD